MPRRDGSGALVDLATACQVIADEAEPPVAVRMRETLRADAPSDVT